MRLSAKVSGIRALEKFSNTLCKRIQLLSFFVALKSLLNYFRYSAMLSDH